MSAIPAILRVWQVGRRVKPRGALVQVFLAEHTWDVVIGVGGMVLGVVVSFLLNFVRRGGGRDW